MNSAAFILTHRRADVMVTDKMLRRHGYTGKIYIVIDDEDEQENEYRKKFGNNVIQFNKSDYIKLTDTMDMFNKHNAVVYARNAVWDIAGSLGYDHFIMLDDDYSNCAFRWVENKKLKSKDVKNFDIVTEAMFEFLDVSGATMVSLCQNGDFIGGMNNPRLYKGLLRKAMNIFFCRTDRQIKFIGTMNEDVTAYSLYGSMGKLFFAYVGCAIQQLQTQSLAGGMTEEYKKYGTFLKSFYSVMAIPSGVKVQLINSKHPRIHHGVMINKCAPMILNERWKK